MKPLFQVTEYAVVESPPSRAAWIETPYTHLRYAFQTVAALAGGVD